VTRCGNLFGGGDLNFSRIVPGTIRSVLRGERPTIRSDGRFVRDYFYVEDASAAVINLAEQMERPEVHGNAFNFGNEKPLTVLELVNQILVQMGHKDLLPVVLNEASHEIREQYLDCAKARRLLNWKPEFALKDGLAKTIEWYRAFFNTTPSASGKAAGPGS
jgi:CDP-glucose 4,6-dehydratase